MQDSPDANNTNFDGLSIHLALDRFLQRQQRNMHSILQLQVLFISLLEKGLRAGGAFANGGGFPWEVYRSCPLAFPLRDKR